MTLHFKLKTTLAPQAVLTALTDFGLSRSEVWPNVDSAHFKVHAQGPGWAEVTEGSSVAGGVWERERYTWDAANCMVAIETLESNTWGPGSRWDYRLTPGSAGGTSIEVSVVRNGKGWKGRLLGSRSRLPALPCFAPKWSTRLPGSQPREADLETLRLTAARLGRV